MQLFAEHAGLNDYASQANGSIHSFGGADVFMWNMSPVPLHDEDMPPFAFARGRYDNWIIHEAARSKWRTVVDATDALMAIHVRHVRSVASEHADHVGRRLLQQEPATAGRSVLARPKTNSDRYWVNVWDKSFEVWGNVNMSLSRGTYVGTLGTPRHARWRLTPCEEPEVDNMCLLQRKRPGACDCEYSPFSVATQSDRPLLKRTRPDPTNPGMLIRARNTSANPITGRAKQHRGKMVPGLPHTLTQLLPLVRLTCILLRV